MASTHIFEILKKNIFAIVLILSAVALYLLNSCLPKGHPVFEKIYFSVIFRSIRFIWDSLSGWIPIPLVYPILFFILIRMSWSVWKVCKRKTSRGQFLINLGFTFSFLYIWFYLSWGLNYNRQDLTDRWGLDEPLTDSMLYKELINQTNLLDSLHSEFGDRRIYKGSSEELEHTLKTQLAEWSEENGFAAFGSPRCRKIWPPGVLLVWSATGMYFPFSGESLYDSGLHPLSVPFTMAHELAHGFGWTHEGDCNFIAYLACTRSSDPAIRYAAEFNYWRYLLASYHSMDPKGFKSYKSSLSHFLLEDLEAVREKHDKYPEFLPAFRSWFYDHYLSYHKIKGGARAYSDIVRMLIIYKLKKASVNY